MVDLLVIYHGIESKNITLKEIQAFRGGSGKHCSTFVEF